jgi:PAS domain S-box-containing protein
MSNRSNNPLFIRSAFNNTPVALAVIDEQGLFFEVNEKFCSVFGYTSAELIHQPFLSFFSESTQQELVAVQQAILHDGQSVQNISCKGKSKTRQSIDLLASFNSFGDESGNRYIITSLTDISFQKQKMEEAESINLRYRSVIEHSIHAFFLAKPDGTIVDANNAAEKMFGYSVKELCAIGRDAIIDNTDPKTQQKLTERAHNGFATGELTGIRKNGERFSFEFSSVKFAGVNGEETTSTLVHDISERKQQEHKLLRSQDEMALILNNTEEMFMVIDKDWNVINYNKATKERAKSILGKELTMGDSLLSLAEPERYSYVKAVYEKVLAGETIRYKHRVDRGFGVEHYQLSYSPVFDADGSCKSFMVTVRDITIEEKVLNEITQNQQLLQQAESIAHVGSWELDVVTDKLFWSDEVFRICGYEPKSFQLTVESGWAVIHPDDRTAFITGLQKAIVGKTNCASDLRFVRPDGTIRYIKSKAKVVLDKERKAVRLIGVFHDVTDQKLMERELAISQQQYKSLFDQNPDAVVSFDLQGNIISVNDAGMLIAEATREKLFNVRCENYFDENEVEVIRIYFKEVSKGIPQRFQTTIVTTTGKSKRVAVSLMPIIIAGDITGVYGILKDITIEKLYEDELEFQSNLLSTIQQSVIVTSLDGTIVYWNNFAEHLYGWQRTEVMGKKIGELLAADISQEQASVLMEQLSAGESWSGEFLVKHKLTEPFKVQIQNSPLLDANEKLIGIVGVSWDITKEVETREYIKFQANLLDNVQQAVIAADLTGVIRYWNHFAEELYGFSKEEAKGENLSIITTNDPHYTALAGEVFQLVAAGKSWSGDFRVRNKQQQEFTAFSINSPVSDAEGNVQGILGVSYDITERKRAEQQKEFDRLDKEALINSTSDLIWSVNREYKLIAANKAFNQSLEENYNIKLNQGDNVLEEELFSKEVNNFWRSLYTRALNGESFTTELHIPATLNSGNRWDEITFNPIVNNEEVIGVACRERNITESKVYQQKLVAVNNQLEMAQQIAKLGYWSHDLKNDVLFWSKEVYSIFGVEANAFKPNINSFFERVHPEDQQKVEEQMQLVLSGVASLHQEHRIILPDNQVRYVLQKGSVILNDEQEPILVEGTIQDITEAKNAEEILKVNEEQLNLIYNTTAGIIFLIGVENNGDDFRFISMNNAGLTAIGLQPKDVFDEPVQKVIPEPFCSFVLAKYKEAILLRKAIVWEEETPYPMGTKTGVVTVTPIFDNDGNCVRLVGSIKDITEQKLSELRLKDIYAQLEQRAAQLQISNTELERFAYVASHDLQEPLRMISSFLQLLEKKYQDTIDEKGRDYIRFAVDGSLRMKYLINDLLDYSRVSTRRQNLEQVNVEFIVKDVLQNLSLRIEEKKAVIKTSMLPVLPNADKTQMVQLFQNLIGNALKYSGHKQPRIEIEAVEKEEEWLFAIKDNGIGFDERFAEKIFVIFQRLHNRSEYSGTGIGLAICKKIIDRHGGKIYAESVPGEGSRFWFTIKKHLVAEQ